MGSGQSSGTQRLRPGDCVMQIRNDYDRGVFDGDIEYVDVLSTVDGVGLRVRFKDPLEEKGGGWSMRRGRGYAFTCLCRNCAQGTGVGV